MKTLKKTNIPYIAQNSKNAYFCSVRKLYIIDDYKNNSLPLRGWFKYCTLCDKICGQHMIYSFEESEISYDIQVPLCSYCSSVNSNKVLAEVSEVKIDEILKYINLEKKL